MSKMHRAVMAGLAVALSAPLAFAQMTAPSEYKPSAVVFPFTAPEGQEALASALAASTAARLKQTGIWDVTAFNPKGPLVVRAVQAGTVTREAVSPPFDAAKASALGKAVGITAVVTGEVMDYTWDAEKGEVKLTAQVQATRVDGTKLGDAVVAGGATKAGGTEQEVAALAASSVAGSIVEKFTGTATSMPVTNASTKGSKDQTGAVLPDGTQPKKKKNNTWLYIGGAILAGGIIAALAGGGGGSGGGGGGGNPPDFPLFRLH